MCPVQGDITFSLPQYLNDDVLPCPDKIPDSRDLVFVHIELGGLNVLQWNRQKPDRREFLYNVVPFIIKQGDVRRIEAKFLNNDEIQSHFPAPYGCFPVRK